METQKIKINKDGSLECEVAVMLIDEDNIFTAYCPALELTTYGDSIEDVSNAFNERLEIFIDEMIQSHSLHDELVRLGWKFKTNNVALEQPANISIPTHLLNHSNRIIKKSFTVPVN